MVKLNDNAMMVLDYSLNYDDPDGVRLIGKKFLLSKTEISSKWKVFSMFKSKRST